MRLPTLRPATLVAGLLVLALAAPLTGGEPAPLTVTSPRPRQVTQRTGFDPLARVADRLGHPAPGYADLAIEWAAVEAPADTAWEYRAVPLAGGARGGPAWASLDIRAGRRGATARVPAGGWYRLEIRARRGGAVTHRGAVEAVGVGEVFLVAGEYGAANGGDERLPVADPHRRVVAFDTAAGTWAVADDPQPAPEGGDGGSIWPPVGDALVRAYGVPIAFAYVAAGEAASSQWLPGGKPHRRLVEAGKALGAFRAVLWQQGESGAVAGTTAAKYAANVRAIRHTAATAWGAQPPWLLAKATSQGDRGDGGGVRKAVDELLTRPGFRPGPDLDALGAKYRSDRPGRQFSAAGQAKAAELWVEALRKTLGARRSVEEMLPDLHLLDPAWASPIVYRESSVLLRRKEGGPAEARLAFPAAEVLNVATADRRHRYGRDDFALSKDGLTLTFARPGPVEVVDPRTLFVPKGSPDSYPARVGFPEEAVAIRRGHWFHDRDVEVTYRRRDAASAPPKAVGSLPRTKARLKAGEKLTLGVAGDSISAGADVSAASGAAPFQPGFPEMAAAQLWARFDSPVAVKNRAADGWRAAHAVKVVDQLMADKPHLVVLAYGMNDVSLGDPEAYGREIRAALDRVRAADRDAEVILVAPMYGNAAWTTTPREMFPKYRDELKRLAGPGVALADVTAVWEQLSRNKHDLDLTGNGLNHPNDFGYRVYAQVLLSLLGDPE